MSARCPACTRHAVSVADNRAEVARIARRMARSDRNVNAKSRAELGHAKAILDATLSQAPFINCTCTEVAS